MAETPDRATIRTKRLGRQLSRGARWLGAALAVVLLLLAWQLNLVRHERLVVAEAARFDARVHYDYEYRELGTPPGPSWLRRMLGDDFFTSVVGVELNAATVDEQVLAAVATLPHLRFLLLQEGMSDQAIRRLGDASELEELRFRSPVVTDAGLAQLTRLKGLTRLSIAAPHVTDVGLMLLEDLPNLTSIELISTDVTRQGVERLRAALPHCDVRVSPEPRQL